jgi:hypothetical protein
MLDGRTIHITLLSLPFQTKITPISLHPSTSFDMPPRLVFPAAAGLGGPPACIRAGARWRRGDTKSVAVKAVRLLALENGQPGEEGRAICQSNIGFNSVKVDYRKMGETKQEIALLLIYIKSL